MRRAALCGAMAGLLVVAACAKTTTKKTASATTSAANQSRTVQVDWTPKSYPGFYLGYFPSTVTVRPGDAIQFKVNFTGEPHSVTAGTLVDKALPAAMAAGPQGTPPPDFAKLPVMLPEGPGDANQVAVNPCFVSTGDIPADASKPCPKVAQPDFDGKQAYYNSGFLAPGETFTMKLASDLAAGTYNYYCNLHGAAMSGKIVVAAKGSAIPTASAVDAAAKAEAAKKLATTDKAYQEAEAGTTAYSGKFILGGYGDPNSLGGVLRFIPDSKSVKVGEKVTWAFFGAHTLTFNQPSDVGLPLKKAPDGTWHLDPKVMSPTGGPGVTPPQQTAPASSGPPEPVVTDGGNWDGAGFRNSGFIAPGSVPLGYSLTFTKAGTYRYVCLIHPSMTGTVTVT